MATAAVITHAHAAPRRAALQPNTLEHFVWWAERTYLRHRGERRRVHIEGFQRTVLADYFNGVKETLLLLPKGNGKTTLLALLALYHLCIRDDASIIVAAAAEKQARYLYRYCAKIVRQNRGLQERLKVHKTLRIEHRWRGGELVVVAADAGTVDGSAATLVLIDELHRHKDGGALYQTLRDGLRKEKGQIISITTAGWDPRSVLGITRARALEHVVRREGAYTYCLTPNGQFAMHEWALDLERHDPDNMADVKAANPLSTITERELQEDHDSPSMKSQDWLRFTCNVWVQDLSAAIPEAEWSACAEPDIEITDKAGDVVVWIDLGWIKDTTAIGAMAVDPSAPRHPDAADRDAARVVQDRPTILTPPGEGSWLPYSVVKGAAVAKIVHYQQLGLTVRVVFDPSVSGHKLAEDLEKELGVEVIAQAQNSPEMSDAAGKLLELIRDRRWAHPDDVALNEHALYATSKFIAGTDRWKFDKGPGGQPNDAIVGCAMGARQIAVPVEVVVAPFAFHV